MTSTAFMRQKRSVPPSKGASSFQYPACVARAYEIVGVDDLRCYKASKLMNGIMAFTGRYYLFCIQPF